MVLDHLSEEDFYKQLSDYLRGKDYKNFMELIERSPKLDIHLDPSMIPHRFDYISASILENLKKVGEFYQTSALGVIIEILRFANQFNLLDKDLSLEEQRIVDDITKDSIFISNLNDLFGEITKPFISFVRIELPKILLYYLTNFPPTFFENAEMLIQYVKNFFWAQYTIYGLSIKKIGTFKSFYKKFNESCNHLNEDFIEFEVHYKYLSNYYDIKEVTIVKRHLISPKNMSNIADKILSENNYAFYSLSMVLLGGIGPQGHGFTYVTPRKEVVEICSDIKENDAIIIKYKLFLKDQFLTRLIKELSPLKTDLRDNIIDYLNKTLNQKELIGYNKYPKVIKIISNYLKNFSKELEKEDLNIDALIKFISDTLLIILRPIDMIDQFKCRIDLINEGKLGSDEIAKLTSLRGKSHYDVLRERLFFQYINDWFYELYWKKK